MKNGIEADHYWFFEERVLRMTRDVCVYCGCNRWTTWKSKPWYSDIERVEYFKRGHEGTGQQEIPCVQPDLDSPEEPCLGHVCG